MKYLLSEIIARPHILTLESALAEKEPDWLAESEAEALRPDFTTMEPRHIRPDIVEADYFSLRDMAAPVESHADKVVAHREKTELKLVPPTYNKVKACAKLMEELVLRYQLYLEKEMGTELFRRPDTRWKEIFRVPWIPVDDR